MDVMEAFGVFVAGQSLHLPVHDPWGRVAGGFSRSLKTKRYTYPPGFEKLDYPYGLHLSKKLAFERDYCIIVEGAFDAMTLYCLGFPVVAALGSSVSREFALWVSRYCSRSVILFDHDQAGRNGAFKAQSVFTVLGDVSFIAEWESHQENDPNEVLVERGFDAAQAIFRRMVSTALRSAKNRAPKKFLGVSLTW